MNFWFVYSKDLKRAHAINLAAQPQAVRDSIDKLYKYYGDYWLLDVTPKVFSIWRDKHRTNNGIESWNRRFNAKCKVPHPAFFDFMSM